MKQIVNRVLIATLLVSFVFLPARIARAQGEITDDEIRGILRDRQLRRLSRGERKRFLERRIPSIDRPANRAAKVSMTTTFISKLAEGAS